MEATRRRAARVRRHKRVRRKITGDAARPRLAVYRSNRHIYVQLVDDREARTLAQASSLEAEAEGDKKDAAKAVGELIARRAKEAGIEQAVLDRGGRLYHGRVQALAEAAREKGPRI